MDVAVKEMFGPLVAATPPDLQTRNLATDHIPVSVEILKAASTRIYSKEEWDAQKPFIEQEYAAGTLETTRKALGDRGFPVTTKQLKRKVMGWGFRKNLKPEEKKVIVRQHELALATGNAALSLDHPLHRPITSARIDRMINRDKIVIDLIDEPDIVQPQVIKDQVITEDNISSTVSNLQNHSDVTIRIKAVASPKSNHLVPEEQLLEPEPIVVELPHNNRGLDFRKSRSDIAEHLEVTPFTELNTWQNWLADDGFSFDDTFTRNDDHIADDEATVESHQQLVSTPPLDVDMMEIHEVVSEPSVSGDSPHCRLEGTQSSEMVLYRPISRPRSNNRRLPREDATTHANNRRKLSQELSNILRGIGIFCEDSNVPKAGSGSKRKRPKTAVFCFSLDKNTGIQVADGSKQIKLRAGLRQQNFLYELGFALVRQPDESISMVLPPPFEGLYMREGEIRWRDKVLEMDRLYGLDDERTIVAIYELAFICYTQNRAEVAENMYRRVVVAARRVLSDAALLALVALLQIANIRQTKSDVDECKKLLDHLETNVLYYHGSDNFMMGFVSASKTNILLQLGKYDEAEARGRSVLKEREKSLSANDIRVLSCAIQLSGILKRQHKYAESKGILLNVIREAETIQEEWSVLMILHCRQSMYRILRAEGAVKEAKRLKEEVYRELEILRPGIDPHQPIYY